MLDTPISEINFYCKRLAKKLKNINLHTVQDAFFYYPFRYEDFRKMKNIKELRPNEVATIKAKIETINNFKSPHKGTKITEANLIDETGKIKAIWFNQWYLTQSIKPGNEYFLVAKPNHKLEFVSPEYEQATDNPTHTGRIVPVYPLTYRITQKQLRTTIKFALQYLDELNDYLPLETIKENKLLDLKTAISNIHFPENESLQKKAIERLAFDELFFTQLKNKWLKNNLQKKRAYPVDFHQKEIKRLVDNLPFELTLAQRRASWEIIKNTLNSYPMNRLLNGDVGSGKTLVAALAIYNCALSGFQSALLAPTEILAEQHYNTFCELFANLGIKIGLITRGKKMMNQELSSSVIPAKAGIPIKSKIDFRLRGNDGTGNGNATSASTPPRNDKNFITQNSDIIIGTHALIQEKIKFNKLALAVVDEQHRFGVEQRAMLAKGNNNLHPHLLSMTATPIPRTMSLIAYGDLSSSILDEMPKGRKEIKTHVVPKIKRKDAYNFIRKQIEQGRQAFVICPLINESDKLGVKSVTEEHKKLIQIFPKFKIKVLHGKLKSNDKEQIMIDFKNKKIHILVSTSVVEVGVDVPNATIMLIEGAERFGLAQLHQFRGRVGRGEHQSYCLLFPTEDIASRLRAMERIKDGFKLAETDLRLRGPGAIYGKEQSGKLEFKLADINDYSLIIQTQNAAEKLLKKDAELKKYPHLRKYLNKKLKNIHLE